MGSHTWFRFYHESMRDQKVRTLSDAEFRIWAAIQTCASESPVRGLLLTVDGPASPAYIADIANVSTKTASKTLAKLAAPGREMVLWNADENCWQVKRWDERQFESDTSTERTRAWKLRQKAAKTDARGNVPRNVPKNVSGTATGTLPGTDTELHRTDLAIDSDEYSSPLSVEAEDLESSEPPSHTEALRILAAKRLEARNRECPDAKPIQFDLAWRLRAMENLRRDFKHVLDRVAPGCPAYAIVEEIEADKPRRTRLDCALCDGSGMVEADGEREAFTYCPECHPKARRAS